MSIFCFRPSERRTMLSVFEALTLAVAFAMLIIALLTFIAKFMK